MADIKLFKIGNGAVVELQAESVSIEKSLQVLLEQHLDVFLDVRFLATEYRTGKTHGGRIDTLGLDDNNCPIIIEYKRTINENVINQGLYYLDWLMDHQGEFTLLVQKRLGVQVADQIEWSSPRLLCIASDFTKFDEHAVQQINRNIELLRYRRYGDSLFLLELVNAGSAEPLSTDSIAGEPGRGKTQYKGFVELLPQCSVEIRDLWEELRTFLLALGDDVQMKQLKYYVAFRRLKNYACVEVHPQSSEILIYAKLDPSSVQLEEGFTRDVTNIGHYGTGNLELRVKTNGNLDRAKPLLLAAYQGN